MAAPTMEWGSIVNSGTERAARLGIYITTSNTSATTTTVNVEVWLWTRYKSVDSTNKVYFDWSATSASTNVKSNVSVSTTSTEWSTSNQVKLYSTSKSFTRSASSVTYQCAAKITGLDYINSTVGTYKSFTIPAKPTYTVSYDANGGSGAPSSQTKSHGAILTISSTTPKRTGYTFVRWVSTRSDGTYYFYPGGTTSYDGNQTLKAEWSINTYTVSYDANGGSGAPSSQTKTYGKTLTISSTVPTRTGYTFLYWKSVQGSETYYFSPGNVTEYNGNQTLVAQWKINTYTVSYNANGGSGAPSSQTKTYGVNLTLSKTVPTRSGYKFLGWGTSSTGSVKYSSGGTYSSNSNVTLYAVWEQLGIAYIKVDGKYKAGKVWVKSSGTWKTGIVFVKDSGKWKQGGL